MSVKTFFEKVGEEVKKLFGEVASTSNEQKVASVIQYVSPLVVLLTGLIGGPAVSATAAGIIGKIQTGLSTVSVVAKDAVVAPGTPAAATALAAINDVQTNLSGLLDLAEVKNSTESAKVTETVTAIAQELTALVENLSPTTPAAA